MNLVRFHMSLKFVDPHCVHAKPGCSLMTVMIFWHF